MHLIHRRSQTCGQIRRMHISSACWRRSAMSCSKSRAAAALHLIWRLRKALRMPSAITQWWKLRSGTSVYFRCCKFMSHLRTL
ncbi:hypothetical protein FOPG_19541 [Fusarium oxysporum f. sp. conglutinans race 2 54008]|uniref:Uncharacterized protein n=1 Tax=Fusarium oxysporum f. sp. conglutinans race 2 54008 TaxID=1089457 RepID=X0GLK6_FUSOX|nr:hypothetical protein FOPG_19541 [Fusarium oxysporum f. sp. conglutinans race 2 54008]